MNETYESPFVKSLERLSLKNDSHSRAVLAKLRRGLGKKEGSPEMYRYVVPFLDPEKKRDFDDERHFLIASLFALHPKPTRGVSMGKVFRVMADLGANKKSESIEKRFEYLLSVDGEDLGGHLRQAVSLAKSKDVSIDFHQLFSDVKDWSRSGKPVQLRWARDFWGYEKNTNNETDSKGETL